MSHYVIGDIHGHVEALDKLLTFMPHTENDFFIFVGDYLDKGSNSKEVLESVKSLKNKLLLLGNHEYAWLNLMDDYLSRREYRFKWVNFIKNYGGIQTILSYLTLDEIDANDIYHYITLTLSEMVKNGHLLLLRAMVLYYKYSSNYLVTHSGYNPDYRTLKEVFENNPESFLFSRKDFLNSTSYMEGRRTIFGHTAFTTVYIDDYKIGIDTGVAYGGPLTSFCLDSGYFYNSNEEKYSLFDLEAL